VGQVRLTQIAPQIEGQHVRIDRLTQVGVVRLGIQELRVGEQLGGRGGGRLGNRAVQHTRLQDFVDEVHVGQHGVGVYTGKLDGLEVGTPRIEDVEGGLPVQLMAVEPGQQIHEVRRRAVDRATMLAPAIVDRAE
jgi:hypothetical protein